jgi:hypothetical protein
MPRGSLRLKAGIRGFGDSPCELNILACAARVDFDHSGAATEQPCMSLCVNSERQLFAAVNGQDATQTILASREQYENSLRPFSLKRSPNKWSRFSASYQYIYADLGVRILFLFRKPQDSPFPAFLHLDESAFASSELSLKFFHASSIGAFALL